MVVKISFDMVIEGLLESQLIQLIPYDFARNLANKLMDAYSEEENVEENISNRAIYRISLKKSSLDWEFSLKSNRYLRNSSSDYGHNGCSLKANIVSYR